MSRPIMRLDHELPGYTLQRQAWIRDMEGISADEDRASMEMLAYAMVLLIVSTACLLAWVVW